MRTGLERIAWLVFILIAFGAGFFSGQQKNHDLTKSEVIVSARLGDVDVRDELDQAFGWGTAPADIEVTAVDIEKDVEYGTDEFPYPMPTVKLAIKNIGQNDLNSFGVCVDIVDSYNKRIITGYCQASGAIGQGWRTDRKLFSASEADWADIASGRIDFPVDFNFSVKAQDGSKMLDQVRFYPSELSILH